MRSSMEIVLSNRARGNERDASVALENGPFDLVESLEPDLVHRREDVFGRDALAVEVLLDQCTSVDENGRARLHDPRESPDAIAHRARYEHERAERRRGDDRVRHRVILPRERAREELWDEEQRHQLERGHLGQLALPEDAEARPDE